LSEVSRVGRPQTEEERSGLPQLPPATQVEWNGASISADSLAGIGSAVALLASEIKRQVAVRDFSLAQQADMVVAYRPFSRPSSPRPSGGVEREILAMRERVLAGEDCCVPAVLVLHTKDDERRRRRSALEMWWINEAPKIFIETSGTEAKAFRSALDLLLTDLSVIAKTPDVADRIQSLLAQANVAMLPAAESSAMDAQAYSAVADQRRMVATSIVEGSEMFASMLHDRALEEPRLVEIVYLEDTTIRVVTDRVASIVSRTFRKKTPVSVTPIS
jgi:hypothetical protein